MSELRSLAENFIPEALTGCWLWSGSLSDKGYGVIYWKGSRILAHRASYEEHRGEVTCEHGRNDRRRGSLRLSDVCRIFASALVVP